MKNHKILEQCKGKNVFFSFFFLFFARETRPRVETEGMTLPQPPEGTGQKRRCSRKKWKSEWTKRSLPCFCKDVVQISALQKFCNIAVYRSGREQQAKKSQREERGGRRIESVARCSGELCRKNKSESKSPSLAIAGSWPADHSPNREWYQKIRKRKARRKDQGRASGMPAARVHG